MRALSSTVALVGRSPEVAALRGMIDRLAAGAGGACLIEGEPGVGKSRLLAESLEIASSHGLQVFAGAAEELERDRPFGALAQALDLDRAGDDPERAEITRLLSGSSLEHLPLGQLPELRFRVVDAIVTLVERLSAQGPVLLAVEDLHWADPSTLLALNHLVRHAAVNAVGFICTLRQSPASQELNRLAQAVADHGGMTLALEPLANEDVTAIATELLEAEPTADLLGQLAGAGGNPFYLTELLATLRYEDAIEISGGKARVREVKLPPSLRLIILRRLGFLPEDTLEVLRAASILGSTFSVTDLSLVLERSAIDLTAPLRTAVGAGVLGESGHRLQFRHDLVRDAIYFDLPLAVRTGLHLATGRALAASGAPASQVASHLALGASPGDADAVAWMRRAAQQAAPRAPTIAVELLEKALELTEPSDPQHDELLAEYVWGLAWSGRPADAQKLASELLDRPHDPSVGRALRHALGVVLWLEGRIAESQEQFEILLRDEDLPQTDRAIVLARLCLRRLLGGDFAGAEAAAREALVVGERSGYDLAACEALGALCWVTAARGDLHEGIEFGRRAIALAARKEADDTFIAPRLYPQSRVYLSTALVDADLLGEANEQLTEGRRLAEQQGADWALPVFHIGLGLCRYITGEWDDAVAELETAIGLAGEVGTRNGIVFGHSVLAHIALRRDDLAAAERAVVEAEHEIAVSGAAQYRVHWAMRARALLEEARGNAAGALGILNAAWALVTSVGMTIEHRELGPDIVRLALASGDRDRAREVVEAVEEIAPRAAVASARGAALRCRGLLDDDPEALAAAVGEYGSTSRLVDHAVVCEEAGTVFARAGRIGEATGYFDESLAIYERVGAQRDAARSEAALRGFGVRRGKRGKRTSAKAGWDSLTPTEFDVVRLAVQGLTNREIGQRLFVSRRTVETHLSHVFGKLALSTRVQLATEAARAGVGKAD